MFNLMDSHREAYERMEMERNELNERWESEKENLRKLKTVCMTLYILNQSISLPHWYITSVQDRTGE